MTVVGTTIGWLTDPANWSGPNGIPLRLGEHIAYSLISLLLAFAVALPAGLYVGHTRRGSGLAVGLATVGRAVPSLALIGLILPITQALDPQRGFNLYPTILAMAILAIPPVLVNAYAGISGVDADLVEAGRGMGFTERQVLGRIEVPIALPVVLGGIRSATVQVIATTTLGAIFALGGLGRFIVDGIAQNDDAMLFGGVTLVAALAMGSEGLLALVQRRVAAPSLEPTGGKRSPDFGEPALPGPVDERLV